MAYSNIGLWEPTPFDPAQANQWANTINGNMTLIDNAIAGVLPLTVTSSNIVLTASNATPDQARNAHFVITGTLTGNRTVFFPAARTECFSVYNGTSATASNYTLTIAANNGSASAAGSTVSVPTGYTYGLVSDGTNIALRNPPLASTSGLLIAASNLSDVSSSVAALSNIGGATRGANTDITSLSGLTTPLAIAYGGWGASTTASGLANFNIGSNALRNIFIQSGGSPSGGSSGDLTYIY